jgi:hypothetical protein
VAVPRAGVAADPTRAEAETSAVADLGLTRLLSIVRLTPAQAVALGADVLAGLADRHAGDALRLTPAELLEALMTATRPSPADQVLVSALERAATEARSPDGRVAIVAAILREADAPGGAQARAELARLVAMATGEVAPPAARPPARAPAPRRGRPRRPPRAVARAAIAHGWKWVLSLVVLATVVLVEIVFLREEISRDVQAVLEAGRSRPTATSTPTLPPVVPPAPTAAGTISRVDLRPITSCTPDAGCALRLQVMLQPRSEPQTITWDFRILDRCTGAAVTVPGGTVTVPPHADRADVVSTVGLPPADALAVLAMTSTPFTAASAAVGIPATGACGS